MTDVSPVAHSDGGDRFGLGDELLRQAAQCVASTIGSRSLQRRCLVSQFWRRYCQTFSTRVQLRGAGRQEDRRNVGGHVELARGVPSGAVEEQNSVSAPRRRLQARFRRGGAASWQRRRKEAQGLARRRGPGRSRRTDVVVALVGRLPLAALPRSRPLPDKPFFWPIRARLEPDFDRRRRRDALEMSLQRAWEVFLKASTIRSS